MDLGVVKGLVRSRTELWGDAVVARRKLFGLNQRQFAALVDGVTVQTISKVENGEIIPRDYLKVAIAAALRTDAATLFPLPTYTDVAAVTDVNGA